MNISNKPVSTVSKNGTNNTWKYVLLALFIIAIMHNFFGALSYDFFVIIDNVLGTSGASSPVFIWTLFGALIGIMLGGMVAARKYKLGKKVKIFSAIPAGIFMAALLIGSGPLSEITPRPEMGAAGQSASQRTDSTITVADTGVFVRKGTAKPQIDKRPSSEQPAERSRCEDETTGVNVTVRSDSVTLHFRTATVKDGEWSDWESIFIPQPGQYMLSSSEGKVIANSIQYYYQVNMTSTRSASDPFTRRLSSGPLIIDTY